MNAGARSGRAPPSRSGHLFACARAAAAVGLIAFFFSATLPLGPAAAAPAEGATANPAPSPNGAATVPASAAPSAATASDEDIRDIRGPKPVLPPWLIPAIVGGVLLFGVAAYAAWRWRRRRRADKIKRPFEIALERLEELRTLMHPASVREFSGAISDVVRRYIEHAFSVTATQRTTEEFLHDLLDSAHASLAPHRKLLAEFLNRCDLAKFAGVSLSAEDLESLHRSARTFVLETSKPAVTHDPLAAA